MVTAALPLNNTEPISKTVVPISHLDTNPSFYVSINLFQRLNATIYNVPHCKTRQDPAHQFWYSLLKYCCTHKYCKIWTNEHNRGIKHTKMVIVGVSMWGRSRSSLILTGVCVMMWKIVIWALTLCGLSWGGGGGCLCVCVCVCVFWGFLKHHIHQICFCLFILLKQRK